MSSQEVQAGATAGSDDIDWSKYGEAGNSPFKVKDELALTKEEKYDLLVKRRQASIKKYHSTDKGKEARKKASKVYYEKNKEAILARKRERYAEAKKDNQ